MLIDLTNSQTAIFLTSMVAVNHPLQDHIDKPDDKNNTTNKRFLFFLSRT